MRLPRIQKCGRFRTEAAVVLLSGLFLFPGMLPGESATFPTPPSLVATRDFWVQAFAHWSVHEVVFHDRDHVDIVYEVIDIRQETGTEHYSSRQKSAVLKKYFTYYRDLLQRLHATRTTPGEWSAEERRVAALFASVAEVNKFDQAHENVRAQTGLREKFLDGLQRQGRYIEHIHEIFREEGVPVELAALPHVESSFNYNAVSRYRAVGLWQFMHRTGRNYLRIDRYIDERRDPIHSTRAVAELFKDSYARLGSWPLAVMAHNHGINGIARAVNALNTRDVATIITQYRSRSFGFASRNFYPEFLAVLSILQDPLRHFPSVHYEDAVRVDTHKLPAQVSVAALTQQAGITVDELRDINPGLASEIIRGRTSIPGGIRINLPQRPGTPNETLLAGLMPAAPSAPAQAPVPTPAPSPVAPVQAAVSAPALSPVASVQVPATVPALSTATLGAAVPPPDPAVAGSYSGDAYLTRVLPEETIWHFVKWSDVSISRLREYNALASRQSLQLHQEIRVPLTASEVAEFEARRLRFHQELEQGFSSRYRITGTVDHEVQSGENVWTLCKSKYNVPYWLVARYNPQIAGKRVKAGDVLIIPVIQRIA